MQEVNGGDNDYEELRRSWGGNDGYRWMAVSVSTSLFRLFRTCCAMPPLCNAAECSADGCHNLHLYPFHDMHLSMACSASADFAAFPRCQSPLMFFHPSVQCPTWVCNLIVWKQVRYHLFQLILCFAVIGACLACAQDTHTLPRHMCLYHAHYHHVLVHVMANTHLHTCPPIHSHTHTCTHAHTRACTYAHTQYSNYQKL